MRTVVIIQARMTSKRLPGKMMMDLAGKPVLQHVIERVKRIPNKDSIVLAVPDSKSSDSMLDVARRMLIGVSLGHEHDVLSRVYHAASHAKAEVVVRITGDCPLLDPEVASRVIELRKFKHCGYASNVHPRSFPKGLDVECFTMEQLTEAHKKAVEGYDREHVTPWIVRNATRYNLASGRFDLARMRWTLDTEEDLRFMRELFAHDEPRNMQHALSIIEAYGIRDPDQRTTVSEGTVDDKSLRLA